jgi:plastocyanin
VWYAGQSAEPSAEASTAQDVVIPMAAFAFPAEVVVPVGSTVVWVNQDGAPHTATADDGHSFVSDLLSRGQRFSLTTTTPGEFDYYCELHGSPGGVGMAGKLKVVQSNELALAVAPAPVAAATLLASPTPHALPAVPFGQPVGVAAFRDSAGHGDGLAIELEAPAQASNAQLVASLLNSGGGAPRPLGPLHEGHLAFATPDGLGLAAWHDDTLVNDALFVSAEDLPTLSSGQAYAAWLSGDEGNLLLGTLAPGRGGALALAFAAPDHANLLGTFDRLTIGRSTPVAASQQPTDPILVGTLPGQALVHVRHILVAIPGTPNGLGFGLGLRQETDELLRHAQFLRDAMTDKDLPFEKLHAEHIVNLIEGSQGDHYGDLNGNGKVENPGDGYGLLANGDQAGYIKGVRDHALLAAGSPDATDDIRLHAGHVDIAGENTRVRVAELRDRARALLGVRSVAESTGDVQRILTLAQQTIQGVDLNGDEQIAPIPGEGGVLVAYQHAQLMAGISLAKPTGPLAAAASATNAPAAAAPAAATNAPATNAPAAAAPAAATSAPPAAAAPAAATNAPATNAPAAATSAPPAAAPATATSAPAAVVPTVAPQSTVAPPAPTPIAVATPAPVATTAPAPKPSKVSIGDNTFTPTVLAVPADATVVWSHDGQRPHTVTADNDTFGTEILKTGATFQQTFSQAGIYLYYCDLHGGPGGTGMAARIEVQP